MNSYLRRSLILVSALCLIAFASAWLSQTPTSVYAQTDQPNHDTRLGNARPSAIFTVTSPNDSGAGTLRDQIAAASAGDTINFGLSANSVITLTSGEIVINKALTIDGSTATNLAISGNGISRIFNASAPLTINSLTIRNGNSSGNYGGGIRTSSSITLTLVNFLSNTGGSFGGAVYTEGTAVITGGLFQDNTVIGGWGGGFLNISGNPTTINGTQFISNKSPGGGDGGVGSNGPVYITNGWFERNQSAFGGGLVSTGSIHLTDTTFISNTVTNNGGGAWSNSTITLTNTQFIANSAVNNGGGLYTTGNATINGALFQNNQCLAVGCTSSGWYTGAGLNLTQNISTTDSIQNQGSTTQNAGSVILFNGTGNQTIAGAGTSTFNNLWVNNSGANVTLGQNIAVTGKITLTTNLATTNNYVLSLGASATVADGGDVIGTVRRTNPAAGAALQYNNQFTTINNANALTQLDVALTKSAPSSFTSAVSRYYTLTPGTGTVNATVQLAYQTGELNGNTEASVKLWRYDSGASRWVLQGGNVNPTNHFIALNGVTQFSDWAIAGNASPTAVTLSSFDAKAGFDLGAWFRKLLGR